MGHWNCLLESHALFHTIEFAAMMCQGQWRDKSSYVLDFLDMWISRRWELHKVQHMKWKWSHMWSIALKYLVAFVKTVTPSKCNSFRRFLASINWRSNYVRASLSIVTNIVDAQDLVWLVYCGAKKWDL
jgi:hypothetical protein